MYYLKYFKSQIYIQDIKTPNFFEILKLQDLEEMIDEEYTYLLEFKVYNIGVMNLEKAEMIFN